MNPAIEWLERSLGQTEIVNTHYDEYTGLLYLKTSLSHRRMSVTVRPMFEIFVTHHSSYRYCDICAPDDEMPE